MFAVLALWLQLRFAEVLSLPFRRGTYTHLIMWGLAVLVLYRVPLMDIVVGWLLISNIITISEKRACAGDTECDSLDYTFHLPTWLDAIFWAPTLTILGFAEAPVLFFLAICCAISDLFKR